MDIDANWNDSAAMQEQQEIVSTIRTSEKRAATSGGRKYSWNKFNGDLVCRVVKVFLKHRLPSNLKLVGPNVYIDGYPTEFDLLLVNQNAIPRAFTNAYRNEEVRFVIEVKSHGYMRHDYPQKLLCDFDALRRYYPNINCVYLTIRETWKTTKSGSISYVEDMKRTLEPKYRAFCLAESRTQEIVPGQWREFVNCFV